MPGQGFGLGRIARGTPEFRQTMRRMAERIPQDPPCKLYISRTKFNGRGGLMAERVIERNMAANGYAILHPEKMELPDQLRAYKSATHILGADSSAFHIAGMVADPAKKIGFILRRDNNAYESIAAQISGMIGREPVVIDALAANWMDKGATFSNHLSWGEVDHGVLAGILEQHGFIDDRSNWQGPGEDEMADCIAWVQAKHAEELVRVPLAR